MALQAPTNMVMNSTFSTIEVPALPATTDQIGAVVAAPDGKWLRIILQNVGAVPILLGYSPSSLTAGGGAGNFLLGAGTQPITIVLAPRQTLYAAAGGAPGRLAYGASEALPISAH